MSVAQYIFVFAQVHEEFRVPELLSVSELYSIPIIFPTNDPADADVTRPFMILGLECDDHARILARRCILIKSELVMIPIWPESHQILSDQFMSFMQKEKHISKYTSKTNATGRCGRNMWKTLLSNSKSRPTIIQYHNAGRRKS
jgi:tRNA G10  N-methylase Trm11